MAEPGFDRARFTASLATRRLGRTLVVRARTGSTNDDAWEAAHAGAPDGTAVVADDQTRGRGRSGRTWHQAPGRGLALSVLVVATGDRAAVGTAPLVAGLALARALEGGGADVDLKWPNDLLARGRKLAGVLCESRRRADGSDAIVVGVGVNVAQREEDFPPELRESATSLAIEGVALTREALAAAFLNALEPLWDAHPVDPRAALAAWRARARFWGRALTVRTPAGEVTGVAHALAEDGALVLRAAGGGELRVMAGDVLSSGAATP